MGQTKSSVWVVAALTSAVGVAWAWTLRNLDKRPEWPGVDEAVIGQIVEEAGRAESEPLLAWVEGDLLLFMFLCAGLLAGFVLGYFARVAFVEHREPPRRDADALPDRLDERRVV